MKSIENSQRLKQELDSVSVLDKNSQGHHSYLLDGLNLHIHKKVFSPKYFNGWEVMTSALRERVKPGSAVLEIGAGSGVTSLLLSRDGANVTATDISPIAVENILLNARNNQLKLEQVILSDVYDGFKSHLKFDVIYWNPPWMQKVGGGSLDSILEYGLFDRGFCCHRKLLSQSHLYLKPGGKIYLGHACFGDHRQLEDLLYEWNYDFKVVEDKPSTEIGEVEFYLYECWQKNTRNEIFLGMPFTGNSFEEIVSKRMQAKGVIERAGLNLLEQFIGLEEKEKYEQSLYSPEFIVDKDLNLLDQAQVMLVDLSRPSYGTSFEIAYAKNVRNIPIFGFSCVNQKTKSHPWLRAYCDEILPDIESAVSKAKTYISKN